MKGPTMNETLFTRILIATGGSPWSERALTLGLQMAKAYQLEVVIVSVLTPAYVPQRNAAWGLAETTAVEEGDRQFTQRVLDQAAVAAEAAGIGYRCELREGRAVDEILKAAESHACDLIILGSRGLSSASRFTLGETGNEVLLKAPVPVLVVK